MADEISEIRSRIDIVELIGQSVSLKKTGKNYKGLCPFHQDKNPSFDVSADMGRYRCWSCGESGDAFNWVMKTQNVEFKEALQILAKHAGVTLHSQDPAEASQKLSMRSAMDAALDFFRAELKKSTAAKNYCDNRGITEDIRDKWELGFAPDQGEALAIYLHKKGFKLVECKSLFLVDGDDRVGYGDKYRARLMFPIRDERGDLVGFGGRLLGDGHPKYINSSDTPLYKKSRVLYGLHAAKAAIKEKRQAVLTEGYLDVIACHACGVETAIASLGTALAEDHAKLLKRWCDGVTILYDSDAAGAKAAGRGAEILAAEGLKVNVALMPQGEDPDTLWRTAGPSAVKKAVEGGLSPLEYRLRVLRQRFQPSDEEFWKEAIMALATTSSALERTRFIDMLAPLYPDIRDQVGARRALSKMVNDARRSLDQPIPQARYAPAQHIVVRPHSKLHPAEVSLFRGLLDPDFRRQAWEALKDHDLLLSAFGVQLAQAVTKAFPSQPPEGTPAEWSHRVELDNIQETFMEIDADSLHMLSEAYLSDAIGLLKRKKEQRQLADLRQATRDDSNLREYGDRLRRLKDP